jgi:hypothetical protein
MAHGSERTKKYTDTNAKETIYSMTRTGVNPPPEVEDRCVIGKRNLGDDGSGDERTRHLKEWEKG